MKPLLSMRDLALDGRTLFMRLDLNCPIKDGVITSDARIMAALPSIRHALRGGARLAIASHLGRPKGQRRPTDSLEPVGTRLSELLQQDVIMSDDCVGDGVKKLVRDLRPGHLLLLQNLRYHAAEEANDAEFGRQLAAPFEVYINDAFGACHRAHASIVSMVQHFKHMGAGFLLEKEVAALSQLLKAPKKPFVALIGGAKVSDKVGAIEALLNVASSVCIGGAMAATFLRATGVATGASRAEEDKLSVAKQVLSRAKHRNVEVLLPVDHVAADTFAADAHATYVSQQAMPDGLMGLDIGALTQRAYADRLSKAATVFWNGPMGVFEWDKFATGTRAMAAAVATCPGYTVVGGGDSVAALEVAGVAQDIDHVSTGGGASLEFLQYGTLPGLTALSYVP